MSVAKQPGLGPKKKKESTVNLKMFFFLVSRTDWSMLYTLDTTSIIEHFYYVPGNLWESSD